MDRFRWARSSPDGRFLSKNKNPAFGSSALPKSSPTMNAGCINPQRAGICTAPLNGRSVTLLKRPTPKRCSRDWKMADAQNDKNVQLDLNNPVFQENWLSLDKPERSRVTDTLKKLRQLTWNQVYRDQGLKWEKVASIHPPKGIDAIYTLRITQARRATAYRDGNFMRLLTIAPDHDAAYGKK